MRIIDDRATRPASVPDSPHGCPPRPRSRFEAKEPRSTTRLADASGQISDDLAVPLGPISPASTPADPSHGQPCASSDTGLVAPRESVRSTRQYIDVARPLLLRRLTQQLALLAGQAKSPSAGQYVLHINNLAMRAVEQFFDDGYLDLVLAVRDALVLENAWARYSTDQVLGMKAVLEKYASRSFEKGGALRHAIHELEALGIDTTPAGVAGELFWDEEE